MSMTITLNISVSEGKTANGRRAFALQSMTDKNKASVDGEVPTIGALRDGILAAIQDNLELVIANELDEFCGLVEGTAGYVLMAESKTLQCMVTVKKNSGTDGDVHDRLIDAVKARHEYAMACPDTRTEIMAVSKSEDRRKLNEREVEFVVAANNGLHLGYI